MNDYFLSQGERIYSDFPFTPQPPPPPHMIVVQSKMNTPEPIITKMYRNAGRKKLTPEQIAARDEYQEFNNEQNRLRRLAERQRRADAKALALEQKKQRSIELHNQKKHLEKLQSLRNKKDAPVLPESPMPGKIIIQGAPMATGVFCAANVPAMAGHVAVRINAKTVIYVKNGKDINQAVAVYKNKHNLS